MVYKMIIFVDHLFILLLFVVLPVYGAWSFRLYLRRIEAGAAPNRIQLYRQTLVMQWVAFAVVAGTWFYLGRPAADIGIARSGLLQIAGGVLALGIVTAYLLYAWRTAGKMSPQQRDETITGLGPLIHVLPINRRDYRHFVGVSLTAGIVEEFLYRGFAFWYLAHYMPTWAVVLSSSVIFGLGHAYQGAGGVARVTLVGFAFGILYVLTGSIWLPILAHIIVDIVQGAIVLELLRSRQGNGERTATQHA